MFNWPVIFGFLIRALISLAVGGAYLALAALWQQSFAPRDLSNWDQYDAEIFLLLVAGTYSLLQVFSRK